MYGSSRSFLKQEIENAWENDVQSYNNHVIEVVIYNLMVSIKNVTSLNETNWREKNKTHSAIELMVLSQHNIQSILLCTNIWWPALH